jgi:hypothetical protein
MHSMQMIFWQILVLQWLQRAWPAQQRRQQVAFSTCERCASTQQCIYLESI